MTTLLYFAYGSNMSQPRLRARVQSAKKLTVARLAKHILRFHKRSQDNSAKCDINYTCYSGDSVHGVIYRIAQAEKKILDGIEGLGRGYEVKHVTVETMEGKHVYAFTYYATDTDPELKPYSWYKEHVLLGARDNGLPADYIGQIERVPSVEDMDAGRHKRELAIYDQKLQRGPYL